MMPPIPTVGAWPSNMGPPAPGAHLANMPVPRGPRDPRGRPHAPYAPLGPSRLDRFRDHVRDAIAGGAAGRPGGIGRTAAGALGAAFPEASIPLAIAVEAKRVIEGAIKGLHDFAETTVEANRHLGMYSAEVAGAYMRLSLGNFRRNLDLADRTGHGTADLVRAVDAMRDALQPYRAASTSLGNQAAGAAAGFTGELAMKLEAIPNAINRLSDSIGNVEDLGKLFADLLVGAFWASPAGLALQALMKALETWFPDIADELKKLVAAQPKPNAAMGAWDAFIRHEAGPNRMPPLNPRRGPFVPVRPPFQK
jgi:hypothetical protein